MVINRLSDCKTVDDFNDFSKNLNVSNGPGRFTFNDGNKTRSYTMNQIVHKWNQCIKKSESDLKKGTTKEWKDLRKKINEELATIEQLNSAPKKNSLGARIKRGAGNLIFKLTHTGPGKSTIISNVKKKHTDVIKKLLDQITKESSNQWARAQKGSDPIVFYRRHIENQFLANHCSFSDVLDNKETLDQVLAHPNISKAFISYAKREDLEDFLNSHLTSITQKILNEPFDNINDLILAFENEGRSLDEVIESSDLMIDESDLLFGNEKIIKALVGYSFERKINNYIEEFSQNFAKNIDNEWGKYISLSHDGTYKFENYLEGTLGKLGLTIADVFMDIEDDELLSELYKNAPVREALISYARINSCEDFLHSHLEWLCKRIYKNRKVHILNAPTKEALATRIENVFQQHGRSVKEIYGQKEFADYLTKSKPLKEALDIAFDKVQEED